MHLLSEPAWRTDFAILIDRLWVTAKAGEAVRFRVLKPGGNQRNHVFEVQGHIWQELPFTPAASDPDVHSGTIQLTELKR